MSRNLHPAQVVRPRSGVVALLSLAALLLGAPVFGEIIITEIHYDPIAADGTPRPDLEFVEIHNPTPASVNLTDWRIRGGIDLNFDDGTMLLAGDTAVIVSFNPDDPDNADRLSAFRAHY